jgi:predicted nucleotidyltransferase
MNEQIDAHLTAIEQKYAVKILYACESGSRAWGFASRDSDYDVRFLCAHPPDWYLSISEKRDVIEYMNDGVLDINGWDLRKTLRLLRKANAPLREWLISPIIYRSLESVITPLKELAQQAFLPETLCHHYLAIAKRHLAKMKEVKDAKAKAYLYVLRPLLCSQWIVQFATQPPMLIDELLPACLAKEDGQVREFVERLLALKRQGEESMTVARTEFFETYVNITMADVESRIPKNPKKVPNDLFDQVFRDIVKACF